MSSFIPPSLRIGFNLFNQSETELMELVRRGDLECIRSSFSGIKNPQGINEQTKKFKFSALHIAIELGKADMVVLLLGLGADPLLKDRLGWNALHMAVSRKNLVIVELLKKHVSSEVWDALCKARVTSADSFGKRRTPIDMAVENPKLLALLQPTLKQEPAPQSPIHFSNEESGSSLSSSPVNSSSPPSSPNFADERLLERSNLIPVF